MELVTFLRDPDRFLRMGARTPAGVLLCGAPGTGTALLQKPEFGLVRHVSWPLSRGHCPQRPPSSGLRAELLTSPWADCLVCEALTPAALQSCNDVIVFFWPLQWR